MPESASRHGRLGGELELAAEPSAGLEQHDLMAARRRHPRRLQPGRPAAGDHDRALGPVCGDDVRHGRLAPGRRVLDAERISAELDPVDAVAGADALADVVGPALHQLLTMWGSAIWPRVMPDHVDMAFGDGAVGGGDVADPEA